MRKTCDDLAAAGYIAICSDPYWRQEPNVELFDKAEADWQKAFAPYNAFDVEAGIRYIPATIPYVRGFAGYAAQAVVIRSCLGGLLAYLTVSHPDTDASVP